VGQTVDALVVRDDDGPLAEIEFFHFRNIRVATTAGLGNVRAVHRRGGVAVIEQLVRAAVAVLARRGFRNALMDRLTMVALEVNIRLDAVTLAATDGLVRLGVRQVRDIRVTTRAEVLGVDRGVELFFVNEQRGGFAVNIGFDERFV
jgi:hypothetical protein